METFQIAHLNLPGTSGQRVDVVIVFLNESFDRKPEADKHRIHDALQLCSAKAGLAGNAVLLWTDLAGRTKFLAPPEQHAFFRSASYQSLAAQTNKTLTCG